MPQTVNEVMTADPRTVAPDAPIAEAARHRRDADVVPSLGGLAAACDEAPALAETSAASPNR